MIDLQAFRGIANDTSVSDRKNVYFANGKETDGSEIVQYSRLCFNAEGKPREFKRPEGLDREQGSIYMRSKLLSLVRDSLGGIDSEAFKEIETKLFGKLGKNGRFDEKFAAKPLKKRDIKAVLATLDRFDREAMKKAGPLNDMLDLTKRLNSQGKFLVMEDSVNPELKKAVEEVYVDVGSVEKLSDIVINSSDSAFGAKEKGKMIAHDQKFVETVGKLNLCKTNDVDNRIPVQYAKDCPRCQHFVLGKNFYITSSEKMKEVARISPNELDDKISAYLTGRENAKFKDLTGDELHLVQFAMSVAHQGGPIVDAFRVGNLILPPPKVMFIPEGKKGEGVDSYGVVKTDSGGLKFIGTKYMSVKGAYIGDSEINLDSDKCYIVQHYEVEYSKERLQKILKVDWSKATDLSLLVPEKQHANFFAHLA